MQVVGHLSEVKPWCFKARPGDEEDFAVGETITQEVASEFAFDVNQKMDGHVWVRVEETALSPEPTTVLNVRKTH